MNSIRVRGQIGQLADELVRALKTRAAGQTLASDISPFPLPPVDLAPAWPVVDALVGSSPFVNWTNDAGVPVTFTIGALPPVTAQAFEKGQASAVTVTLTQAAASLRTFAIRSNVSLQAGADAQAYAMNVMGAAVARAVDTTVLTDLASGATAATSLSAAVAGIAAAVPGEILIVVPVATANLVASGYRLIVDPNATANLVIGVMGVSFGVLGPTALSKIEPSVMGFDTAAGAYLTTLTKTAGSVATVTTLP